MKKRACIFILVLAIFLGGNNTLSASQNFGGEIGASQPGITLYWKQTSTVTIAFGATGGEAKIDAIVHANTGTVKITATINLYRVKAGGNETVKTWSGLFDYGMNFATCVSHPITPGYTYIAELTTYVYWGLTFEKIVVSLTRFAT